MKKTLLLKKMLKKLLILLIRKNINFLREQKIIMNYMDQLSQEKFQKLLRA